MTTVRLDESGLVKRNRTRARARIILRFAARAMRDVQEMQRKVKRKQDKIKKMREAAAQGGPNSPSRSEQIAAVKEVVALQREQKRAERALSPQKSMTRKGKR